MSDELRAVLQAEWDKWQAVYMVPSVENNLNAILPLFGKTKDLLSAARQETATAKHEWQEWRKVAYSRGVDVIRIRKMLCERTDERDSARQEISDLKATIKDTEELRLEGHKADQLNDMLKAARQEIERLKGVINDDLLGFQKMQRTYLDEIERLKASCKERDAEIARLDAELAETKRRLSEHCNYIDSLAEKYNAAVQRAERAEKEGGNG